MSVKVWEEGDTSLGPRACPICGSVGTGRYMPEHIAEEHPPNVKPLTSLTSTAGYVSEGDGYPNWTLYRMGDIFRAAGKLMAVYNAAPMDQPPDMDFYRQQMRVLYDLLHEDGR